MPERQEDIDALLAEVSALADEAIADIGPDEAAPGAERPSKRGKTPAPSPAATARIPPGAAVPPPRAGAEPSWRPPSADAPLGEAFSSKREDASTRILYLEVPVIVQLAKRTMPLSDIVGLATGAIIEFEKPWDSSLDLMINNKCIGQGQAVKVGEKFGLRVGTIGTVRERIQALGSR